jgi:putative membrane protein
MGVLINLILITIAVAITSYITPGISLQGWFPALATAVVLGVLNAFLKPVLVVLTLPISIMTLGLFLLVINALIVLLAAKIVPGFKVDGFYSALLFSIVLSIVSYVINSLS